MQNDEIKEILDNPRILMLSYGNFILLDDYVKLKDYITNLQQENNNLKTSLDESQEVVIDLQERIEKAVEYMRKHIEKCNIDGYEGKFDNFDIFTKPQDLLNILNGRSDE